LKDAKFKKEVRRALKKGRRDRRLRKGVPRLKVLRLLPKDRENEQSFVDAIPGLNFRDHYAVLGEAGATGHYIMLNQTTGQILPGIFHLSRFQKVPVDEL
jgi:hypothetical protein